MKRNLIILTALAGLFLTGCSSGYNGQLIGAQNRPGWTNVIPYGMIYVPSGTLHIGPSDQDVNSSMIQRSKSISIQGFYMDDTEITNNEYRQFVNWVRDSITAKTVGGDYLQSDSDDDGASEGGRIDWERMQSFDYADEENAETIDGMYYTENERLMGKKEFDVSKFTYEYYWVDIKEAAKTSNKNKPRSEFFKKASINAYPDTLVWVRDFS